MASNEKMLLAKVAQNSILHRVRPIPKLEGENVIFFYSTPSPISQADGIILRQVHEGVNQQPGRGQAGYI